MRSQNGVAGLTAAFLVLSVSACSGSSSTGGPTASAPVTLSSASSSPISSAPAAAPDDPKSAAKKALAAYRAMWAAFAAAQAIPDPSYPALSRYATGAALSLLQRGIAADKAQGLKGTGETKFSPEAVEVSPADEPVKVTVRDCLDSSGTRRVSITPGPTPFKDTPGGRRLAIAFVHRQGDGSWKVTEVGVRDVGTC